MGFLPDGTVGSGRALIYFFRLVSAICKRINCNHYALFSIIYKEEKICGYSTVSDHTVLDNQRLHILMPMKDDI